MLRSTRVPSVLLSLALVACGASRSPVPLVGTSNDLSPLAGDWAGGYSSAQSQGFARNPPPPPFEVRRSAEMEDDDEGDKHED